MSQAYGKSLEDKVRYEKFAARINMELDLFCNISNAYRHDIKFISNLNNYAMILPLYISIITLN